MSEVDEGRRWVARALRDAIRHLQVAHAELRDGAPVRPNHAAALLELATNEAPSVSELASRLAIDRTNVSRLAAKMDAAGEIEQGGQPIDRRSRPLRLTERGRELAAEVDESTTDCFIDVVEELGPEAGELVGALERIVEALRRRSVRASPTPWRLDAPP